MTGILRQLGFGDDIDTTCPQVTDAQDSDVVTGLIPTSGRILSGGTEIGVGIAFRASD